MLPTSVKTLMLVSTIGGVLGAAELVPLGGRLVPLPETAAGGRDLGPARTLSATVRIRQGWDAADVAARHGLQLTRSTTVEGMGTLWTISGPRDGAAAALRALAQDPAVSSIDTDVPRRVGLRAGIEDPLYLFQYHLAACVPLKDAAGTVSGYSSVGINLPGVPTTVTGNGVNIAIVDTGIDMAHEDLLANLRTDIDIDVWAGTNDPAAGDGKDSFGDALENHGTAVAGVAAAVGNTIGVHGVAAGAGIVSVRFIVDGMVTASQEAKAITVDTTTAVTKDQVAVSNNSWGPMGGGPLLETTRAALAIGTENGRGGRGVVYVFASGNDREYGNTVDYDEYASSCYVIGVGATTRSGAVAFYSQGGVGLFCCAPVGETSDGIITTDRTASKGYGSGNYTTTADRVLGTSFAAPQVAGVAALMVQANPALTWRDVRHALARTAVKVSPTSSGWCTLTTPDDGTLHWHPDFGFGLVDAAAAVAAVDPSVWKAIPGEASPLTATSTVDKAIPDNSTAGVSVPFTISGADGFVIETVQFSVSADHADERDLEYALISPAGNESTVVRRPLTKDYVAAYLGTTTASPHVFTSLRHWGESANGVWKVVARDRVSGVTGTLKSAGIVLRGYKSPNGSSSGSGGGSVSTGTPSAGAAPAPSTGGGAPASVLSSGGGGGSGGPCGVGSTIGLALIALAMVRRRR